MGTAEVTEKDRRVYYQSIVYDVCNALDRIFGKRIGRGEGVVCGTVDTPTRQVQEHMAEVVKRCAEWAEWKAATQPGESPPMPDGQQIAGRSSAGQAAYEAFAECGAERFPPWDRLPDEVRVRWGVVAAAAIRAAVAEERELAAQTAEWEHARGTNGIGIARAIRAGHRRVD